MALVKQSFLLLFCLSMFTACNSVSDRQVFQTLYTTNELVNVNLDRLEILNRDGELTRAQYDNAKRVHKEYQIAMNLALDAAEMDWQSVTPNEVYALALKLGAIVENL